MDELKWKWTFGPYLDPPEGQKESAIKAGYIKVVSKQSADAILAEKDAEIAELKQKLEDVNDIIKTARKMLEDAKASHYAEMVDAGMRERRLRRALYKACANWARVVKRWAYGKPYEKWEKMESKCRAKAEEYK